MDSMRKKYSDLTLKRRSIDEYKTMKKAILLKSMQSFISNFDKIRYKYIELQLENNYFQRRIEILETRIRDVESLLGRHKVFKHYKQNKEHHRL